jgi:type III restriction enzyme
VASLSGDHYCIIYAEVNNSPFAEPKRHFRFTDDGISDEIVEGRRASSYFIPIARPKKRGKQLQFQTEWTQDRVEPNKLVNRIRERVNQWRRGGYVGITTVTRQLLEYWTNPDRERRLFFCQIEALETFIYITEVSTSGGSLGSRQKTGSERVGRRSGDPGGVESSKSSGRSHDHQ